MTCLNLHLMAVLPWIIRHDVRNQMKQNQTTLKAIEEELKKINLQLHLYLSHPGADGIQGSGVVSVRVQLTLPFIPPRSYILQRSFLVVDLFLRHLSGVGLSVPKHLTCFVTSWKFRSWSTCGREYDAKYT